jgi:hypothetical protein
MRKRWHTAFVRQLARVLSEEFDMATKQDVDAAIAGVNQKLTDALKRVSDREAAMQAASATLQAAIDSLNEKLAAVVNGPDLVDEVTSLTAVGQTLDAVDPAPALNAPLAPDRSSGTGSPTDTPPAGSTVAGS